MGVRLKEDIRQCLAINALPKEVKQERMEDLPAKAKQSQPESKVEYVLAM